MLVAIATSVKIVLYPYALILCFCFRLHTSFARLIATEKFRIIFFSVYFWLWIVSWRDEDYLDKGTANLFVRHFSKIIFTVRNTTIIIRVLYVFFLKIVFLQVFESRFLKRSAFSWYLSHLKDCFFCLCLIIDLWLFRVEDLGNGVMSNLFVNGAVN